jgi:hypothetical protein
MTSDGTRSPSQPPIFWLSVAGAALLLLVLGVRLVTSGSNALGAGVLLALVITALVVAGFALSIAGRVRRTREAFPNAIHMPIVVGPELATATRSLSESLANADLQLRASTYATIAVDTKGLHFVSDAVRPKAAIETSSVTVSGLGSTMSGSRMMGCIMIDVQTEAGPIRLPIIPMRLKSPLRTFKAGDLDKIADNLGRALTGEAFAPGWPY